MSRRAARFTEADVRRAAKVAAQLGLAVEITPDGTIRLLPAPGPKSEEPLRRSSEIVL